MTPDIVTMARSVSGFGLPLALMLARPQHDILGPAEHNGTYRGNTHAIITATTAIRKFWSDTGFQQNTAAKARLLTAALEEMSGLIPDSRLKGRGMMQGLDVGSGELAASIWLTPSTTD